MYKSSHGLFFPFGIRAIVLDRWRRFPGNRASLIGSAVYKGWKFYLFSLWFGASTVLLTQFAGSESRVTLRPVLVTAITIVMFGCIAIGLEASLSYITFGGWSLTYHKLNVASKNGITEFAAYAGGAISLIVTTAAGYFVISRTGNSYASISPKSGFLPGLGDSFYYSLTSLTGNGDPGPLDGVARTHTVLTYVSSVLFLVIVVSLLFNAISSQGPPSARL